MIFRESQSPNRHYQISSVVLSCGRINIRNIISIMTSQGDTKINVDDFRWKASVINEFEAARNDALVLAGDPTAYLGEKDTNDEGINETEESDAHGADEFQYTEIEAV
jgi:hypothetical protein